MRAILLWKTKDGNVAGMAASHNAPSHSMATESNQSLPA